MADGGSEKQSIGSLARNTNSYGSTTSPLLRCSKYVKHNVSRVDTLQGIALKYGSTVSNDGT